jgi:hypothetical protein
MRERVYSGWFLVRLMLASERGGTRVGFLFASCLLNEREGTLVLVYCSPHACQMREGNACYMRERMFLGMFFGMFLMLFPFELMKQDWPNVVFSNYCETKLKARFPGAHRGLC